MKPKVSNGGGFFGSTNQPQGEQENGDCAKVFAKREPIIKPYHTILNDLNNQYKKSFKKDHELASIVLDMYKVIVQVGTTTDPQTTQCKKEVDKKARRAGLPTTSFTYDGYITDFVNLATKASDDIKASIVALQGVSDDDILSTVNTLNELLKEVYTTVGWNGTSALSFVTFIKDRLGLGLKDAYGLYKSLVVTIQTVAKQSPSPALKLFDFWVQQTKQGQDTIDKFNKLPAMNQMFWCLQIVKDININKDLPNDVKVQYNDKLRSVVAGQQEVFTKMLDGIVEFFMFDIDVPAETYEGVIDILTRVYVVLSTNRTFVGKDLSVYASSQLQQVDKKRCAASSQLKLVNDTSCVNESRLRETIKYNIVNTLSNVISGLYSERFMKVSSYVAKNEQTYTERIWSKLLSIFTSKSQDNTLASIGMFRIFKKHDPKGPSFQIVLNSSEKNIYVFDKAAKGFKTIPASEFKTDINTLIQDIITKLTTDTCARQDVLNLLSTLISFCKFKATCMQRGGGRKTVQMRCPKGMVYNVPLKQCTHFQSIGFKKVGGDWPPAQADTNAQYQNPRPQDQQRPPNPRYNGHANSTDLTTTVGTTMLLTSGPAPNGYPISPAGFRAERIEASADILAAIGQAALAAASSTWDVTKELGTAVLPILGAIGSCCAEYCTSDLCGALCSLCTL